MKYRRLIRETPAELVLVPPGKVLLVDDDVKDLEYHFNVLQGFGQQVVSCASYAHGAILAESGDYDLILVSQGGPAFEGRVILQRSAEKRRGIPIVVLARCKDMRCYLEAMQLGADDYVEKPVSPIQVKHVLERCLRPLAAPAAFHP